MGELFCPCCFYDALKVLNAKCNESLLPPTREVVSDFIRHVEIKQKAVKWKIRLDLLKSPSVNDFSGQ